jgi:hypothetical protein
LIRQPGEEARLFGVGRVVTYGSVLRELRLHGLPGLAVDDAEIDFYEFEFEKPSGIRIIGDIAINHYGIRFMGRNLDGSNFRGVIHVSHTWIKEESQWKLLSGMAYDAE